MDTNDLKITKEQKRKLIKNNEEPIGLSIEKYKIESEKVIKNNTLDKLNNLEKEAIKRKNNKTLGIKTKKSKSKK